MMVESRRSAVSKTLPRRACSACLPKAETACVPRTSSNLIGDDVACHVSRPSGDVEQRSMDALKIFSPKTAKGDKRDLPGLAAGATRRNE